MNPQIIHTLIRYGLWALGILAGLLLAGAVAVWALTHSFIYADISAIPTTQVAMVLGASVESNGTLSPVLAQRTNTAIALYKAHKVSKILVTGDNAQTNYDEVTPVKNYLLSAGIVDTDIFLDHAGFDTYSSMYRARDVFAVESMTIVTQPFHLPRAVFLARSLGLTVYGAEAGQGELYLSNTIREIPAFIKAMIDLRLGRVPKYVGNQFPITGDGTKTW